MAEPNQLLVRDLFPTGPQIEQTMKDALSHDRGIGATRLAWGVIGSQATDALKSVLNIDALELLGSVWCAVKDLHEYTDRSKHPEGERSVAYLGPHKFTKTLYPQLAVTIAPFKPVTLRFTLLVLADIRSIALTICNGCITTTGAGDGVLSSQLKYGDVALNKLQSKKLQLPGSVTFKSPGLAIV